MLLGSLSTPCTLKCASNLKKKRQGYHVTYLACFSSLRITELCCFQHLKIVSFFPQFTASPWQIIEIGILFLKQNYKHKRKWIIYFQIPQSVFKFLWEDKLNKYLPSFFSLLLQVSVHILSYQRGWASKRRLSHLPPLMRWNVNRDLKEERKQPLQASGWKAFQKDSSVCVEGLDSGASWRCLRNSKETRTAKKQQRTNKGEMAEKRSRGQAGPITQGQGGHGAELRWLEMTG